MWDPKVHVGVSAVVMQFNKELHDWEVLMVRRAENATHGTNTWALPGGWLDWGQTPAEAAARELYEETGVCVRPVDGRIGPVVVNTYSTEDMHVLCANVTFTDFNADNLGNKEPDKHDEVRWMALELLEYVTLFPATRSILEELGYKVRA